MGEKGWIKLYRRIQDCWIWDEKPFDKPRAWIDILLLANHADKKIMFNGNPIVIKRGQYLTSIRKLSERWGWSYDKVSRFLNVLVSEDMLQKESDSNRTLLTVINYEVYQDVPNTDECTDRTPTSEPIEHSPNTDRTPTSDKQELKELKELKNDISASNETVCRTDVQRIITEWNTLAEYGIKSISKLSNNSKRYNSLVARIKEYSVEEVLQAIENIRHSKFLQGKANSKKTWVITFDWFVLPNNFPKVLENQYEDKQDDGRTTENNRQNKIYTDEWCDHIYD